LYNNYKLLLLLLLCALIDLSNNCWKRCERFHFKYYDLPLGVFKLSVVAILTGIRVRVKLWLYLWIVLYSAMELSAIMKDKLNAGDNVVAVINNYLLVIKRMHSKLMSPLLSSMKVYCCKAGHPRLTDY